MERLNLLWQAVSVAGELRDITTERRTFVFNTLGATTFYLRAERASVQIMRWSLPRIEVRAIFRQAFGWQVATDQDTAGVYVVAHRRRLVGTGSSALFEVAVPQETYLILKLQAGQVALEDVDGTLHLPPVTGEDTLRLLPG